MPLAAFLMSMVGPLVGRVLLALGFSIVTVGGLDLVMGQLKQQVQLAGLQMGADAFNLFQVGGGGIALGIIMGAINTRIALWVATRSTRLIGKSN